MRADLPDCSERAYSTALMTKAQPPTRHIISINDLTNKEIETIFEVAQGFLKELADDNISYRIGRSTNLASKFILASLFYEPSTRTRLSFESAMLRLGGANITSADPAVSSAAKGESLADTIRVISNYCDIVIIRHPRDGAARLAAEYSQIPVINGGDGSHEHPTQTLCDLFTLKAKKKSLKNMKVAIAGDLKGSRTIHSFVYALARFGATIDPLPAPGMELPPHVDRRLREEFHCRMVSKDSGQAQGGSIDALYVTADQPHQLSLIPDPEIDYGLLVQKKIDAVYVTRFQKERWTEKERPYPKIDAKFLDEAKFSDASVMHPLPRVNELDASFDTDRRAVYFQQAAYGVPIRMALISLLLHLQKNKSLSLFGGGFAKPEYPIYVRPIGTGLQCDNPNCITGDPAERQYAANKFYVIDEEASQTCRLRCLYCEKDVDEEAARNFVVADTARKTFSPGFAMLARAPADKLKHLVIHRGEAEAVAAGFAPREGAKKLRTG
jgi:aspartate carbamoyltransferase catalytic subunit